MTEVQRCGKASQARLQPGPALRHGGGESRRREQQIESKHCVKGSRGARGHLGRTLEGVECLKLGEVTVERKPEKSPSLLV